MENTMKFIIIAAIIGLFCIGSSATEQGYVAQILTSNDGTSDILFKLDNGTYAVNNNPNKYLVISKDAKGCKKPLCVVALGIDESSKGKCRAWDCKR
jgi:hypothetical protein